MSKTYTPINHEKEVPLFEDKLLREKGLRIKLGDTYGIPKYGPQGAEPIFQVYRTWEFNLETYQYDIQGTIIVNVAKRKIIDIRSHSLDFNNLKNKGLDYFYKLEAEENEQ